MKRNTKKSNLEKLREIVDEHQYQKINGVIVDVTSANAILQVYDVLKHENKKKYESIIEKDIIRPSEMAWRLLG